VRHRLSTRGMSDSDGNWSLDFPDVTVVRPRLESLIRDADLSANALYGGGSRAICACGDRLGAIYYAARHNLDPKRGKDCSLVITFDAEVEEVAVDSRDFLCPVFQGWDRQSSSRLLRKRQMLVETYGPAIGPYFDAAADTGDQRRRVALCMVASVDVDVVKGHLRNRALIGGRHGTIFSSAFLVRSPIRPEAIRAVRHVSQPRSFPVPTIVLGEVLFGHL
jgi:hypothetical protein